MDNEVLIILGAVIRHSEVMLDPIEGQYIGNALFVVLYWAISWKDALKVSATNPSVGGDNQLAFNRLNVLEVCLITEDIAHCFVVKEEPAAGHFLAD